MNTTTKNSSKPLVMKRQFTGEVVSAKEDKTIRVRVSTVKMHAKYRKQYTTGKKYAVHDDKAAAKVGDVVLFEECRPLSKTKKWRLVKVIS